MKTAFAISIALGAAAFAAPALSADDISTTFGPNPALPKPQSAWIPTINIAPAKGWQAGAKPAPAQGLQVTAFAEGLDHPRWLHVLPNGDVLVAETNAPERPERGNSVRGYVQHWVMSRAGATTPTANRISLLRDADGDGVAELKTAFLTGLNSPFGMALVGNELFIANTDAVVKVPYEEGQTQITAAPVKVADLPGGPLNHHWTKSLVASPDGSKLYAGVGSNSNVAEHGMEKEEGRAAVWEIDVKTGASRVFASGLRNPVGIDFEPQTNTLWTAVNERDEIGDNLVPDYITSVRDGGFYGWPWSYFGQVVDERVKPARPDMVAKAIKPDYAVGAHTASLGLSFADGAQLGERFANGAFIGQHGSWNRTPPSGYKVVFIPFSEGKPAGEPVDVLTGFLDKDENAQGRPVGVTIDKRGALLVADDVGNKIWRVTGSEPRRDAAAR
ncbi:MAG: sorbosone dehydrogenase family protein [Hyphomicrobiales bacterium]|nr:sorbosone dehydrogenase family protein [Hyphomicrobiales bacterium]